MGVISYLKRAFSPNSVTRTGLLNDNNESAPYNEARNKKVSEELHAPVRGLIHSTRTSVGNLLKGIISLPKKIAQGSIGFATDLVTAPVGLAANIGRYGMDLLRLPPRIALIATDHLSEKTFGKVSRMTKSFNAKIHEKLGTKPWGGYGAEPEAAAA